MARMNFTEEAPVRFVRAARRACALTSIAPAVADRALHVRLHMAKPSFVEVVAAMHLGWAAAAVVEAESLRARANGRQ